MTYSANLLKDLERVQFYCVVRPRRKITGLSLVTGSIYKCSFSYGFVTGYENNGVTYSQAATAAAVNSTNRWFYDQDAGELYVYTNTGYQVATFELYFSTEESTWHRIPDDASSATVFWSGSILKPPEVSYSGSTKSFGTFPVDASSLRVRNDKSLMSLLYDSSFNNCDVVLWQRAGREDVDNIEKVLTALTGDLTVDDQQIEIQIADKTYGLDKPFDLDTFGANLSTRPDPNYIGKPFRKLWGYVEGVRLMNVAYEADTPGTSDNRFWVACDRASVISNTSATVVVSTNGDTELAIAAADAKKFRIGSRVYINHNIAADEYDFVITDIIAIDATSVSLELDRALASHISGSNATVNMSFVQRLWLVQNNGENIYRLLYGRDYINGNFSDYAGIQLQTTAEANVSASTINPESDYLVADCYGKGTMPTIGGVDFYEVLNINNVNIVGKPYMQGMAILYDILNSELGIAESDIDTQSFLDADSYSDFDIGLSVPETIDTEIPTYRDVINKILTTMMCKMYVNAEGKFVVKALQPVGTSSDTVDRDEQFEKSYDFSFQDIRKLRIKWGLADSAIVTSLTGDKDDILDGTSAKNFAVVENEHLYGLSTESDENLYLHKNEKQTELELYVCNHPNVDSLPANYASRLAQIYGDRDGLLTLISKHALWSRSLNDTLTVEAPSLPGFEYDKDMDRSRDFAVVEIEKNKDNVRVVLDDQKAIVDNPGSW